MRVKFRILGVQIDKFLSYRRGKFSLILLGNGWGRFWWQQRSHACLIKKIGFVVNRSWRDARFFSSFLWRLAPKKNGSNILIGYLCRVLEQRTNLLPLMSWLTVLVPTFAHRPSCCNNTCVKSSEG